MDIGDPPEDEVFEYAVQIGIDPENEPELLWIARQGITAPLPPDWKLVQTGDDDFYFLNTSSGTIAWEPPTDDQYRTMVSEERKRIESKGGFNRAGSGSTLSGRPITASGRRGSSAEPPRSPSRYGTNHDDMDADDHLRRPAKLPARLAPISPVASGGRPKSVKIAEPAKPVMISANVMPGSDRPKTSRGGNAVQTTVGAKKLSPAKLEGGGSRFLKKSPPNLRKASKPDILTMSKESESSSASSISSEVDKASQSSGHHLGVAGALVFNASDLEGDARPVTNAASVMLNQTPPKLSPIERPFSSRRDSGSSAATTGTPSSRSSHASPARRQSIGSNVRKADAVRRLLEQISEEKKEDSSKSVGQLSIEKESPPARDIADSHSTGLPTAARAISQSPPRRESIAEFDEKPIKGIGANYYEQLKTQPPIKLSSPKAPQQQRAQHQPTPSSLPPPPKAVVEPQFSSNTPAPATIQFDADALQRRLLDGVNAQLQGFKQETLRAVRETQPTRASGDSGAAIASIQQQVTQLTSAVENLKDSISVAQTSKDVVDVTRASIEAKEPTKTTSQEVMRAVGNPDELVERARRFLHKKQKNRDDQHEQIQAMPPYVISAVSKSLQDLQAEVLALRATPQTTGYHYQVGSSPFQSYQAYLPYNVSLPTNHNIPYRVTEPDDDLSAQLQELKVWLRDFGNRYSVH